MNRAIKLTIVAAALAGAAAALALQQPIIGAVLVMAGALMLVIPRSRT